MGVQSTSPGSQVYLYPCTPSSSPGNKSENTKTETDQLIHHLSICPVKSDTNPHNKSDFVRGDTLSPSL